MNIVTNVTYTSRIKVVKINLNAELIKPNSDMELKYILMFEKRFSISILL